MNGETIVAKFYSKSGDGARVKHFVWQDPDIEDSFIHRACRLTDNPVPLMEAGWKVNERCFFGKYWFAEKAEYMWGMTWITIAECVRELVRRRSIEKYERYEAENKG